MTVHNLQPVILIQENICNHIMISSIVNDLLSERRRNSLDFFHVFQKCFFSVATSSYISWRSTKDVKLTFLKFIINAETYCLELLAKYNSSYSPNDFLIININNWKYKNVKIALYLFWVPKISFKKWVSWDLPCKTNRYLYHWWDI